MLSRVANALFWMSRNIERADNNARILRLKLVTMLEKGDQQRLTDHDLDELLEICGSLEDFKELDLEINTPNTIYYLLDDMDHPNSIHNCIYIARDNAKITREIISQDLWEVINEMYWYVERSSVRDMNVKELQQHLYQIIQYSITVQGVVQSLLIRNRPYSFIQIGKWLERAEKTSRVLNVLCEKSVAETNDIINDFYYRWMHALKYINGYDAFLKKYPPFLFTSDVLAFLISDTSFPRSIAYCFQRIHKEVLILEDGEVNTYSYELFSELDTIKQCISDVENEDWKNKNPLLFLDDFQNHCQELGTLFARSYYLIHP